MVRVEFEHVVLEEEALVVRGRRERDFELVVEGMAHECNLFEAQVVQVFDVFYFAEVVVVVFEVLEF